jgi:hypothetical protein
MKIKKIYLIYGGIIAYFDRWLISLFAGFVLNCITMFIRADYHFTRDWASYVNKAEPAYPRTRGRVV